MNQNRKDQNVPNRQSNTEKAEGSRHQSRGSERNRSSESSGSPSRGAGGTGTNSVLGNKESFEHGSGTSEMARGMGSSGERGKGSDSGSSHQQGGGISNRGRDQERDEQSRVPERGRSQSRE
jgi:hypothetical protein